MYVVWLYGISYTLLGRTRGHGHPPLNVALCHRQHWKIQIPQLSSLYVNLYFSDRKIHLTHVNISDFDTELRLVPLKCGCLVRILRVCDGSLSTTDARDMSVYRKLSELLCSLELIHLGNDISPPVRSDQLHLTVQGLQNQPETQAKSRPEYLLSSSSEKSGERMREKRNSGQDQDYGGAGGGGGGGQQGQGGLTLSVTANFYALQQKLMREMWLRNSRVIWTIKN